MSLRGPQLSNIVYVNKYAKSKSVSPVWPVAPQPLFIKLPNLESLFPFFLILPFTDPISPLAFPLELVLAPRGPRVSLLLLLPAKLNRLPSVARGFDRSRVGDGIGDLDLVGEANDIGPFLVRSGEVTGDTTASEGGF
jgi:hypothetical protein